jgi:hypothetical protein
VQLEAARPRGEAGARLGQRVAGVRVDAREGGEPVGVGGHLGQDPVVRRRVAAGLSGREDDRALHAGTVQPGDQVVGAARDLVGVVEPGVGVCVDPPRPRR